MVPEINLYCGANLIITASTSVPKNQRGTWDIDLQWDGLPEASTYTLRYNLVEADDSNYWSASWDMTAGHEWWGDTYTFYNSTGANSSGSYTATKDLTIYGYNKFLWVGEIFTPDTSGTLVAKSTQAAWGSNPSVSTVTISNPTIVYTNYPTTYTLQYNWYNLPSGKWYKLIYGIYELETGYNYPAAYDYATSADWTGSEFVIDNTNGANNNGYYIDKRYINIYHYGTQTYNHFKWWVEIRDYDTDELIMSNTLNAICP
jgi:hypothetical protein